MPLTWFGNIVSVMRIFLVLFSMSKCLVYLMCVLKLTIKISILRRLQERFHNAVCKRNIVLLILPTLLSMSNFGCICCGKYCEQLVQGLVDKKNCIFRVSGARNFWSFSKIFLWSGITYCVCIHTYRCWINEINLRGSNKHRSARNHN